MPTAQSPVGTHDCLSPHPSEVYSLAWQEEGVLLAQAPGSHAASPGRRKVVLVAMLISCRCSRVSVWKRRMEEPEEKAIQTPLPAFTM